MLTVIFSQREQRFLTWSRWLDVALVYPGWAAAAGCECKSGKPRVLQLKAIFSILTLHVSTLEVNLASARPSIKRSPPDLGKTVLRLWFSASKIHTKNRWGRIPCFYYHVSLSSLASWDQVCGCEWMTPVTSARSGPVWMLESDKADRDTQGADFQLVN